MADDGITPRARGVNGGGSGGAGGGAHHPHHHQHHHHQAHGHAPPPHHAHHPHLSPHATTGRTKAHPSQHPPAARPPLLHGLSGTGLKESMRQAALNNWSLDGAQMADLCSSINQFFTATGVIPTSQAGGSLPLPAAAAQAGHPTPPPGGTQQHPAPQAHGALHPKSQAQQHNQHISSGNMYMDSRQSISAMMTSPGYPHLPHLTPSGPPSTAQISGC
ncbi:hypothetical protein CRUP_009562 [Coryphaenoides rupestris]|nr:hypothetical protein CRUP_009562 [Coryphaenoides rupestris]